MIDRIESVETDRARHATQSDHPGSEAYARLYAHFLSMVGTLSHDDQYRLADAWHYGTFTYQWTIQNHKATFPADPETYFD